MSVAATRVPARAVGQRRKIGYPGLGALRVHFSFFLSLCRLVFLLVPVVRRVFDSVAAPSLHQLGVRVFLAVPFPFERSVPASFALPLALPYSLSPLLSPPFGDRLVLGRTQFSCRVRRFSLQIASYSVERAPVDRNRSAINEFLRRQLSPWTDFRTLEPFHGSFNCEALECLGSVCAMSRVLLFALGRAAAWRAPLRPAALVLSISTHVVSTRAARVPPSYREVSGTPGPIAGSLQWSWGSATFVPPLAFLSQLRLPTSRRLPCLPACNCSVCCCESMFLSFLTHVPPC